MEVISVGSMFSPLIAVFLSIGFTLVSQRGGGSVGHRNMPTGYGQITGFPIYYHHCCVPMHTVFTITCHVYSYMPCLHVHAVFAVACHVCRCMPCLQLHAVFIGTCRVYKYMIIVICVYISCKQIHKHYVILKLLYATTYMLC